MNRRGFTLLEVLVAVTIFAIVLSSIYGVVASTLMASNRAESKADLYANGREIVLRMADELEGALPPLPGSDVAFVGKHGSGSRPEDSVEFFVTVRKMHSFAQRVGGRALVAFSLDPQDGKPGVFALRRHEEFAPSGGSGSGSDDMDIDDAAAQEAEGTEEGDGGNNITARWLTDNVAGLKFSYYDNKGELVDHWDTTELTLGQTPIGLPAAVQISLFLYDEAGATHEFSTIVDLPLANLSPTPGVS